MEPDRESASGKQSRKTRNRDSKALSEVQRPSSSDSATKPAVPAKLRNNKLKHFTGVKSVQMLLANAP